MILDRYTRDEYIKEQMPLAVRIAKGFAKKYGLCETELISMAMQKLVEVGNRYDPSTGKNFKSYVLASVRGYCFNYMRDHSRKIKLPRRFTDLLLKQYKYQKTYGAWNLTIPELAEKIGVEPRELEEVHLAMNMTFTEIKDTHAVSDFEEYDDRRRMLAIASLDKKTRGILEMFYLDGKSYREIGREFKMNSTSVKRVITNAVSSIS